MDLRRLIHPIDVPLASTSSLFAFYASPVVPTFLPPPPARPQLARNGASHQPSLVQPSHIPSRPFGTESSQGNGGDAESSSSRPSLFASSPFMLGGRDSSRCLPHPALPREEQVPLVQRGRNASFSVRPNSSFFPLSIWLGLTRRILSLCFFSRPSDIASRPLFILALKHPHPFARPLLLALPSIIVVVPSTSSYSRLFLEPPLAHLPPQATQLACPASIPFPRHSPFTHLRSRSPGHRRQRLRPLLLDASSLATLRLHRIERELEEARSLR